MQRYRSRTSACTREAIPVDFSVLPAPAASREKENDRSARFILNQRRALFRPLLSEDDASFGEQIFRSRAIIHVRTGLRSDGQITAMFLAEVPSALRYPGEPWALEREHRDAGLGQGRYSNPLDYYPLAIVRLRAPEVQGAIHLEEFTKELLEEMTGVEVIGEVQSGVEAFLRGLRE